MKRKLVCYLALLMSVVMLSSCSMPSISELKPAKTKEETQNSVLNVPTLPALTDAPETTSVQTTDETGMEPSASEVPLSPIGYWLMTYYKSGSEELDEAAIKTYSKYFSAPAFIVLEEGGTGFLGFFGEDTEVTWTDEKIGDTGYTYDEKQLVIGSESGNVLFKFERTNEKPPSRGQYVRVEPTTAAPVYSEAQITETVILDEKGVKVTAKSISYGGWFGPELKLLIENNSGKDLTFSSRDESVNGYMISGSLVAEVANGKKKNDSMFFDEDDLSICGIEGIAEIEFSLHVYDSKSWDTYFDSKPLKIQTNIADVYQQNYEHSGTTIYDKNGVKIVVIGLDEEGWLGPEMYMYIENNTKKNISIYAEDLSVNGFMIDGYFSSSLPAGKKIIDELTFYSSDLKENEIKEIKEVELSFRVSDADNWNTLFKTDKLTVEFD